MTTQTLPARALLDRPGILLALLNIGLGFVLIVGGTLRTSSPSFQMALDVMTPDQWGVLFTAGGVICLLAASLGRAGAIAVGIGAGIHFFWALMLVQAAHEDDRAALTGCVAYSWFSLAHVWTGWRLARRVA